MNLSINLNKIALIRNARGQDQPNIENFALSAVKLGVDGLTLHPRPDLRHATPDDVSKLREICEKHAKELNIEGNPFSQKTQDYPGFLEIIKSNPPFQVTLVPDENNQLTSDHGWDSKYLNSKFFSLIEEHTPTETKFVSIFVDHNFSALNDIKGTIINSIEIYTGPLAKAVEENNKKQLTSIQSAISKLVEDAKSAKLKVNAGHDLNLDNLKFLKECAEIDEVSIGHSLIVDALKYGFDATILKYINAVKGYGYY